MTDKHQFSPSPRLTKTLVICLLALLTACAEEDPKKFVQEGTALFDKGDMDGARVQFRNALQANPKLAEAYYGLALLDEKKPDWAAMKKNLQEVVAIDPNHVAAMVKLGFLLINDVGKAKEKADLALKLEPENNEAILLDGRVNYEQGKYDDALKQAERVLSKEPENPKAYWLKAYALMAMQKDDLALAVLDQGLAKSPGNVGLNTLKVQLHEKQKQYGEVLQDFDALIKLHPEDKKIRIDQINSLIRYGSADKVEAAMLQAIEKYPDDMGLKLQLVNFIAATGNLDRTEAQLKEFISAAPKEVQLKNRLADLYLAKQQTSLAQTVLNEIVSADANGKDGLTAKVRLAELAWAQNDKAIAETLAEEVIAADGGNSGALLFRASTRLAKHDTDGAISDLRIVLRDQPNSDQAMVLMGKAYAMKGEFEVAESQWRKALEVNPGNLSALGSLTSALFSRSDAARAEELIVKSLKASPANPTMLELLVQARAAQKNWVGAEAAVDELKKQPQAILAAQLLKGMLAASQGQHADAIKIYRDILTQRPGAAEALLAMGRSYEASGQRAEFFTFLKEFLKQNPNSMPAYSTLGMAYAAEKKWVEAGKILQEALQREPRSVATYKMLAGILIKQGKAAEVPGLYLKGLSAVPNNPELMLELAKFYDGSKNYESAITAYDDLLKKYPDSEEAANNLSYLLAEFGGTPDNIARAVTLSERFKDSPNPFFMDTYGWALFKSGNANAAIDVFKNTVARVPTNSEFRYHLGEAYFAAGDKTAARQELEKSLSPIGKQNEFAGIDRAKELLKQLAG